MDAEEQGCTSSGATLLIIIGEPFSDDHKSLILEEITKGFQCWDSDDTGIDINVELEDIARRASLGEEGANGERLIQNQSDKLSVEILINPLTQSVKNSVKKLLILPSATKYIIYAGHAFQGTGSWVLQDDVFSFSSLAQILKNVDVEKALQQNIEASLTIHTLADSHWGTAISKFDSTTNLRIQLNPSEKLSSTHGVTQFVAYVSSFITNTPVTSLLQASEQFGNISFTRPTLYIFPGCQGDSALFGINGFNLLVNGGYNRKACFWDFARHLDRVDAMLLTHLGPDNIFGLNTALQRKSLENIHPQIGYLFFNTLDKPGASPPPIEAAGDAPERKCSLLVNLAEEANKITTMAQQLGITPQSCSRSEKSLTAEPINLYHKLGHGSLDMYALNPITDSKEMKEFHQNWSKKASNLGSTGPFPLQNALSVCTMLVWRPHNVNEKIVRIFFPGNAPQHKIAEGLEKMKNFAYLKHPSCTAKDLQKPAVVKKAASSTRPGSSTARSGKAATSTRPDSARGASSRMESSKKSDVRTTRPVSPPKSARSTDAKKRSTSTTNVEDKKDASKQPAYMRSTASSSSNQARPTSPRKTPSPVKSAKSPSPCSKSPSPTKSATAKSPTKAKTPEIKAEAATPDKGKAETAESINVSDNAPQDLQKLKPESDQNHNDQQLESEAMQNTSLNGESNGIQNVADKNQTLPMNGDSESHKTNGANAMNGEEEEEVQPQALPEPVEISSPTRELDNMPDYSSKIENDQQELSEFDQVEKELQDVDNGAPKSFDDPAEDIPSSPEPTNDLQDFNDYPAPKLEDKTFETPVFSNDEDSNGLATKEQKIEYGIEESSRAMAGIQEESEPEEDGENAEVCNGSSHVSQNGDNDLEKNGNGCDGFENSSLPAAFDRDSSPEVEMGRKDVDSLESELPDVVNNKQKVASPNAFMSMLTDQNGKPFPTMNGSPCQNPPQEQNGKTFDPISEWGEPMGLPSPPPASPQKSSSTRPASGNTSRTSTVRSSTTRGPAAAAEGKKRPATAPARSAGASSRPVAGAKSRPSRSSPTGTKVPPLPPMSVYYMDLTYIPNHGDPAYSDIEFFKRIRARYYVLSALSPNLQVLNSLMEAKALWEQKDLEVTVIPTYDNETLRHFVGLNKEKLQELRIDLTPAVSRCTIQLQDLETSLPAYRLEV